MGRIVRWFTYGPNVLTVAEFARMAGISQATVRRLIAHNELAGYSDEDQPMIIPLVDARRWMEGLPPLKGCTYHVRIRV